MVLLFLLAILPIYNGYAGKILPDFINAVTRAESLAESAPSYTLQISENLLRHVPISVQVTIHPEMYERHNLKQKDQIIQAIKDSFAAWVDRIREKEGDEHLPQFTINVLENGSDTKAQVPTGNAVLHLNIVKFSEKTDRLGGMTIQENPNGARMEFQTHFKENQFFGTRVIRFWYKDFLQLATHELGHFLGLAHSDGRKNQNREWNLMAPFEIGGTRIHQASSTELSTLIDYRKRAIAVKGRALNAGATLAPR